MSEGRTSVLIVEDESIVAHDVQQTLNGLGYDAFAIAASAAEAMARAGERRPDVVLMDIRIKGPADGIAAAEALRERFGVPVVFLTAHADDATLERARGTRPYGYVLKPVRAAEMKSAIEVALHMHELNTRLAESEERYRDLVENSLGLICTHDLEGRLLSVNPAGARIIGREPVEMVGRSLGDFIPERYRPELRAYLERIRAERTARGLLTLSTKDGGKRVISYQNVLGERRGAPPVVLGHAEDVTDRILLERHLHEQNVRDPLTGCHNRRYLDEFTAKTDETTRWGCLIVDIDHFKQYNETHGHQSGDAVLITMGRFLQREVRAAETVVRMGGDEFLALLTNADAEATRKVAERLSADGSRCAPVPFTLGWATREGTETLEATIDRADRVMFRVRAADRSRDSKQRKEGSR
jgi:diguanylate cyclase (GGDEF)-like protein/PAS domain S-box-containing protein